MISSSVWNDCPIFHSSVVEVFQENAIWSIRLLDILGRAPSGSPESLVSSAPASIQTLQFQTMVWSNRRRLVFRKLSGNFTMSFCMVPGRQSLVKYLAHSIAFLHLALEKKMENLSGEAPSLWLDYLRSLCQMCVVRFLYRRCIITR